MDLEATIHNCPTELLPYILEAVEANRNLRTAFLAFTSLGSAHALSSIAIDEVMTQLSNYVDAIVRFRMAEKEINRG